MRDDSCHMTCMHEPHQHRFKSSLYPTVLFEMQNSSPVAGGVHCSCACGAAARVLCSWQMLESSPQRMPVMLHNSAGSTACLNARCTLSTAASLARRSLLPVGPPSATQCLRLYLDPRRGSYRHAQLLRRWTRSPLHTGRRPLFAPPTPWLSPRCSVRTVRLRSRTFCQHRTRAVPCALARAECLSARPDLAMSPQCKHATTTCPRWCCQLGFALRCACCAVQPTRFSRFCCCVATL
jgi:hypothetical protein